MIFLADYQKKSSLGTYVSNEDLRVHLHYAIGVFLDDSSLLQPNGAYSCFH